MSLTRSKSEPLGGWLECSESHPAPWNTPRRRSPRSPAAPCRDPASGYERLRVAAGERRFQARDVISVRGPSPEILLSTSVPLFLARLQSWQERVFPVPCFIPGWGWWLAAAVLFLFRSGSGWLWCVTVSHSRAAPGSLSSLEDEGWKNPRNGPPRNTRRVFELQTRVGSNLASTS